MKYRYSIGSLLLTFAVVALLLSLLLTLREKAKLADELAAYSDKFGPLDVTQGPGIAVVALPTRFDGGGNLNGVLAPEQISRCRLHVPFGLRPLVRVGRFSGDWNDSLTQVEIKASASLNTLSFGGEEVLSMAVFSDMASQNPRAVVHSATQTLIDHVLSDVSSDTDLRREARPTPDDGKSYRPGDRIPLATWRDHITGDGVAIWIDVEAKSE